MGAVAMVKPSFRAPPTPSLVWMMTLSASLSAISLVLSPLSPSTTMISTLSRGTVWLWSDRRHFSMFFSSL